MKLKNLILIQVVINFLKRANYLIVLIKKLKCKLLDRALTDKNYLDRTLSGNSIESIILRKYEGVNICTDTNVEFIIKNKSKITGIECLNKINKKIFNKVKEISY